MAFPTIVRIARAVSGTTNALQFTPTWTWIVNTAINAGDNVIWFIVLSSDGVQNSLYTETTGAGWDRYDNWGNEATSQCACAYANLVTTGAYAASAAPSFGALCPSNEQYSAFLIAVKADAGYKMRATYPAGPVNGNSTNSDPVLITNDGGYRTSAEGQGTESPVVSRDAIVLATRTGDGTTVPTAGPTGYTNFNNQAGGGTNGVSTSIATKAVTLAANASENPGAFTVATEQWLSTTVMFWQVADVPSLQPPLLINNTTPFSSYVYTPVPSGAPCQFDPFDKARKVVLSNNNLTVTFPGSYKPGVVVYAAARATVPKTSGKYHIEYTCGVGGFYVGVTNEAAVLDPWAPATYGIFYNYAGSILTEGWWADSGYASPQNKVVGVDIDLGAKKVWFSVDGVQQNGDPVAGTGGWSFVFSGPYRPMAAGENGSSTTITANFGATSFLYPTAGFSAWDGGPAQSLTPGLLSNSSSVFAPTVTRGAVTLLPGQLVNSNTLYGATVTRGPVSLLPGLLSSPAASYSPTVASGTVTLSPGLLTNSNALYAASVAPGTANLSPGLLTNNTTLFTATVTRGPVSVSPGLLTNTSSLYPASVTPGAVILTPGLQTNAVSLLGPTVTRGTVTLAPPTFYNTQSLYTPTVVPGSVSISPPLLDASPITFTASVAIITPLITPVSRVVAVSATWSQDRIAAVTSNGSRLVAITSSQLTGRTVKVH